MAVASKRVVGRRRLHFESHQDVINDAHRLSSMPVRQLGNWSLGQVCHHLAKTVDVSIDGSQIHFPLVLRMIAPLVKKRFLKRTMSAGFKVPKSGAVLLPDPLETAAGLAALEKAVARLETTGVRKPHGLFGAVARRVGSAPHAPRRVALELHRSRDRGRELSPHGRTGNTTYSRTQETLPWRKLPLPSPVRNVAACDSTAIKK